MDEESRLDEFEAWHSEQDVWYWLMDGATAAKAAAKAAWLESARRADKRAREECCEVVRARKVAIECATEFEQAYNHAIDDFVQAIIETIPEQK